MKILMHLKINSCGVSDCAPDWSWSTAQSGYGDYDLWAVFRGCGAITPHGAEEIRVSEGTCLLLTPNTCYTAWHDPARPLLVINVHFNFTDKDDIPQHPHPAPIAKSIAAPAFFQTLLMRTVSLFNSQQEDAAAAFLAAAIEEFNHSDALSAPDTDSRWMHIINEICVCADSAKRPPSLSELAEKYGYSERYIGKMFKKIRQISFSDYIINSRISKAKTLLCQTDLTIAAIAEETGFYDACHFSRCFGRITGTSPLKFRKEHGS